VRGVRWHSSVDESPGPREVEFRQHRSGGHGARVPSDRVYCQVKRGRIRYALDRSYVLFVTSRIEPISHPIRAWSPLGKPQRIEEVTYESPALPLSYSAEESKLTEHDLDRQLPPLQRIPIEQHIPVRAAVRWRGSDDDQV
jgi:hypothetical protein